MSDRLRIVSVCRSLPTPDDPSEGVFVMNRIAALSRAADVRVIQPIPYLPGVRPLPRWARAPSREVAGVAVHHAPMLYIPGVLKSLDGFWLGRAIAGTVADMHRQLPIDLLDAHFGHPDGAGCVRVGRQLGIPVFITMRGFEEDRIREPIVGAELVNALRSATGCIAVSHSLRTLALRHGVGAPRIRVVHNAIDREMFSAGDRLAARAGLTLPADAPLIVSVGRLVSLKRHHVLLDAFARLRQDMPAARLAIVGARSYEPDYPEQLRRQARSLGIESAVQFVGNVPQGELVAWLRAANAFALLSSREGCCNAVLEALAVGVPVVVTPAGDNAEFVQAGSNGFVVPIDDADAATRALAATLQRRDWDRSRISADLVAKVGSWQVVAERVIAFFGERLAAPEPLSPAERADHGGSMRA